MNKSILQIEWHSLIRDLVKNIWVIVLAALTGLIAVYVAGRSVYSPVYTSSATLIVTAKSGTYLAYTNLSASSEMAEIFTEVFTQQTVRDRAAAHAGEEYFAGDISASVITNTNILTLSVTAPSPEQAYRELCAVLEVYPEISGAIFSDAVVDVMRSPNVPTGPSNSAGSRHRLLAAAGSGLAAAALIAVISVARDTVKNEKAFREKVGEKLLGTVPHEQKKLSLPQVLKRKKSALLLNSAYASFSFTESYQKIANRISYLRRHGGDQVFLLTSVAENEGKSTAAANIALALASRGSRVILLDMDFLKPALYKIMGVHVSSFSDFAALLSGSISPENYKIRRYKNTSLYMALNARRRSDYTSWIGSETVGRVLDLFKNKFDYIIIDTPPMSFSADVSELARRADKSLLVVRTDRVRTADINDAVLKLSFEKEKFAGCILNDVYGEFSFFGQTGLDETGYYGSSGRYGKYGKYSKYENYEKYAKGDPGAADAAD